MPKNRDLDPLDPFPANQWDALNEFVGTAALNFQVRIKSTDATTLQVPAGTGNDQVAVAIGGRWRYITATAERSGSGAARSVDVWVTAADNAYASGSPGENDNTNYSFALAITETGATPSTGTVKRKVAVAGWDGARFVAVDPVVGGAVDSGQRWRPGDLKFSARKTPEPGWLVANGAAVTLSNPALRAALLAEGSPWGTDGSGNPFLPPMSGRVPVGAGIAAGAPGAIAHAHGDVVGEEKHAISVGEMPSHDHGGATGSGVTGSMNRSNPHAHNINGQGNVLRDDGNGGTSPQYGTAVGGGFANVYRTTPITDGADINHEHAVPALAIGAQGGAAAMSLLQPGVVGTWLIKT